MDIVIIMEELANTEMHFSNTDSRMMLVWV